MLLKFQRWPASSTSPLPEPQNRIALLHGMGGTGALWRPVAASLENHYWLTAFDQRGHGGSRLMRAAGGRDAQQDEYTPLNYGRDVVETLEAENFHPTWLIGHSMGVRTACAVAHLKPEYVRGLILVDLGFSGAPGGSMGPQLAQFVRILPHRFETREQARAFMNEKCPDPAIAQYLMAVSVRAPDGSISFPFDHSALIETIQAATLISVRTWVEDLVKKGMPILVLRGERSLVWTHEDYEQERQRFAPYPSILFKEIAGAGHGLPFEQRQLFVSEVTTFVTSKT